MSMHIRNVPVIAVFCNSTVHAYRIILISLAFTIDFVSYVETILYERFLSGWVLGRDRGTMDSNFG